MHQNILLSVHNPTHIRPHIGHRYGGQTDLPRSIKLNHIWQTRYEGIRDVVRKLLRGITEHDDTIHFQRPRQRRKWRQRVVVLSLGNDTKRPSTSVTHSVPSRS